MVAWKGNPLEISIHHNNNPPRKLFLWDLLCNSARSKHFHCPAKNNELLWIGQYPRVWDPDGTPNFIRKHSLNLCSYIRDRILLQFQVISLQSARRLRNLCHWCEFSFFLSGKQTNKDLLCKLKLYIELKKLISLELIGSIDASMLKMNFSLFIRWWKIMNGPENKFIPQLHHCQVWKFSSRGLVEKTISELPHGLSGRWVVDRFKPFP